MPAWKSLIQLAGSEFVAKLGNMLILWLLTFKYGTETQGQWSLFMLLSTLLLRITSLNLGYGLRIEISKNQCTQPFRHLAVILIAQGSLILILYFAYSLFSSVIEYKFYRILCLFVIIELAVNNSKQILQSYHIFKEILIINVVRLFFRMILAISIYLTHVSISNIINFYLIIEFIMLIFMLIVLFVFAKNRSSKQLASYSSIFRQLWSIARPGYFSSLGSFTLSKSDGLWINGFFGIAELGLYSLSKSIVNILGVVGTPLSDLASVKNENELEGFRLSLNRGNLIFFGGFLLFFVLLNSSVDLGIAVIPLDFLVLMVGAQILNTMGDFGLNMIARKYSKWGIFYIKLVLSFIVSALLLVTVYNIRLIIMVPLVFYIGSYGYFIVINYFTERKN